jgi:hypothetical protein
VESHEEPESIDWSEFRATFRAHHVPQGVIKLKKEFEGLEMMTRVGGEWEPIKISQ